MGRHVASAGFGSLRQQVVVVLAAFALTAASFLYVVFADGGREGARSAGARTQAQGAGAAAGVDQSDRTDSGGSRGSARPTPTDTSTGSTPGETGGAAGSAGSSPEGSGSGGESTGSTGSAAPSTTADPPADPSSSDRSPTSAPPSTDPPSPVPPSRSSGPATSGPPVPTDGPTAPRGEPSSNPPTMPPTSPEPTEKPKPTHPVQVRSLLQPLGGLLTTVTVENNSSEPLDWKLSLVYEQVDITLSWDATVRLDGNAVVAHGGGDAAVLEPGEQATFGFVAFATPGKPVSCAIAGASCRIE